MQEKNKQSEQSNAADIAREAFRRLAARRIAPTPNAYREIYNEVAGTPEQFTAEKVLTEFTAHLNNSAYGMSGLGSQLSKSLEARNWQDLNAGLRRLCELHFAAVASGSSLQGRTQPPASRNMPPDSGPAFATPSTSGPNTIPLVDDIVLATESRRISLVDPAPHLPTNARSIPLLVESEPTPARTNVELRSTLLAAASGEGKQTTLLRDLLVRTLALALTSLLQRAPELATEAEALASTIKEARDEPLLNDAAARLKQLCFKIELKSGDMAEEHELLLRLFRLLLENISELVDDDAWLRGQVTVIQELLSGPINYAALMDATRSMKDVIYKQGVLKHSLSAAKSTVKNMVAIFIDRLGAVATHTGNYHEKIDEYSQKISHAKDINELNTILQDVMRDTRDAQTEVLRSRDEMVKARQEVQDTERRIQELESKLQHMSELAQEDQLTGSLNRRGLDDVLEREIARSDRRQSPLCIALFDLDDFKKLNDTYGHGAGDEALIHVVRVVKDTLRTMDVIGRFGGEEFLVVLPDTPLDNAVQTIARLQRELTKRIFMHNHEKLLITFSAGLAMRQMQEDQASLIKRADEALYKAKKAGKNRVALAS